MREGERENKKEKMEKYGVDTFIRVDAIARPIESRRLAASSGVGTGTYELSVLRRKEFIERDT